MEVKNRDGGKWKEKTILRIREEKVLGLVMPGGLWAVFRFCLAYEL